MAGVPDTTKDDFKAAVSDLTDTTHGLSALKALIDAIPTDHISQSDFDTRMAGVPDTTKDDFKAAVSALTDTTHGLSALKALIDAIPTDHISQSDFDTRMADVPDTTKDEYKGSGDGGSATITQSDFDDLMDGVPIATKQKYRAGIPDGGVVTAKNSSEVLTEQASGAAIGKTLTWITLWDAASNGTLIQKTQPGSEFQELADEDTYGFAANALVIKQVIGPGETSEAATRALEGRIAGGLWVQCHDGDPGDEGTENVIPVIGRIEISESDWTIS